MTKLRKQTHLCANLPQGKKDKNVIGRLRVGPCREKLWPRAWKCCPRPAASGSIFKTSVSFRSRDIQGFKICNLAKVMTVKYKDISAGLYQKCCLCSKILVNVFHNTSLTAKHGAILYNEAEVFNLPITNPNRQPMNHLTGSVTQVQF